MAKESTYSYIKSRGMVNTCASKQYWWNHKNPIGPKDFNKNINNNNISCNSLPLCARCESIASISKNVKAHDPTYFDKSTSGSLRSSKSNEVDYYRYEVPVRFNQTPHERQSSSGSKRKTKKPSFTQMSDVPMSKNGNGGRGTTTALPMMPMEAKQPSHSEQSETGTSVIALVPELKGKFNFPLVLAIFACGFGSSFQFGFHFGCLNTPEDVIIEWQKHSFQRMHPGKEFDQELIWSITVGALTFGALWSTIMIGFLADTFGRKRTLMCNNVIVVLFCILMALAFYLDNYILMIVARFVIGINAGINTGLSAMYLNEIAPINLRGAIGCIEQLFGIFGILFSQIIGIPFFLGSESNWQYIFYIPLFPLAVQVTLMGMYCPESPKYTYIIREQVEQAERDLIRLRAKKNVIEELLLLEEETMVADRDKKYGIWAMLKDVNTRWLLVLALFMSFTVQFSGFGAIEVYSTQIFKKANLTPLSAKYATCGLGVVIAIMVILCVFLVEHPRVGRRILYLISTSGCCLFTALSALVAIFTNGGILSIVCLMLYIVLYSIGMGSISAVYLNEFFPTEARATGCGIAMFLQQSFRLAVHTGFPSFDKALGHYSFLAFTGCLALSTFFGFIILPETKNKSQDQIEHSIVRRRKNLAKLFVCCCNCQLPIKPDPEGGVLNQLCFGLSIRLLCHRRTWNKTPPTTSISNESKPKL